MFKVQMVDKHLPAHGEFHVSIRLASTVQTPGADLIVALYFTNTTGGKPRNMIKCYNSNSTCKEGTAQG